MYLWVLKVWTAILRLMIHNESLLWVSDRPFNFFVAGTSSSSLSALTSPLDLLTRFISRLITLVGALCTPFVLSAHRLISLPRLSNMLAPHGRPFTEYDTFCPGEPSLHQRKYGMNIRFRGRAHEAVNNAWYYACKEVEAIKLLTMLLTVDRASTEQRAGDPNLLALHPARALGRQVAAKPRKAYAETLFRRAIINFYVAGTSSSSPPAPTSPLTCSLDSYPVS